MVFDRYWDLWDKDSLRWTKLICFIIVIHVDYNLNKYNLLCIFYCNIYLYIMKLFINIPRQGSG